MRGPVKVRLSHIRIGSATGRHASSCASVPDVSIVVILLVLILVLLLAGSLIGLAFSLLWLALTGLIIGALGRLVLPGRQEISLLATALIGIAASLLGGILANLFDVGWLIQLLVAVALAALGVTLFSSSEHRRRPA
jgi:uncharacterized membrane protein YeaQ/YmgE (transglycosylase-associated protein family)